MFLQTGLGLARNQWDSNFGAFDPLGYQLRRVANLPWMDYQQGDWVFSSAELPRELWQHWTVIPNDQRDGHGGYNPGAGCYFWGFRPPDEDTVLLGVRNKFGLGRLGALPSAFNICTWRQPAQAASCPAPPPCPTCPPPPNCPTPAPTPLVAPVKYGVNVGLLVAGALTAGVGYYGYRKGWFRKKSA